MADLTPAKAGTKLSHDARARWARRIDRPLAEAPAEVAPKSPGIPGNGAWMCVRCGEVHRHNFDAWSHADKRGHKVHAWINGETGLPEEP